MQVEGAVSTGSSNRGVDIADVATSVVCTVVPSVCAVLPFKVTLVPLESSSSPEAENSLCTHFPDIGNLHRKDKYIGAKTRTVKKAQYKKLDIDGRTGGVEMNVRRHKVGQIRNERIRRVTKM